MTKTDKNYLVYPFKTMNITQSYTGKTSHYTHSKGLPYDYPIDEAGADKKREYFYCCCDRMIVTKKYTKGTNTIWLTSVDKVVLPNNKTTLVTIMLTHPNDDDINKIKVGDIFKRGDKIIREGTDGNATGNHLHIVVGTGSPVSSGWVKNNKGSWVINTSGSSLKPEDSFYIDKKHTTIKNSGGLKFKNLPNNKKSIKEIAKDVIKGLYGNGQARKDKLTKEGYNYTEVQNEVNKQLGVKK